MERPKYLIVGRSGSGKDTLAKELEKHGLTQLTSYTTREPRTKNDNSHIFITKEEASTITDRAAETVINGHEYFTTFDQVEDSDIYIIDPIGVYRLVKKMTHLDFIIIYITPGSKKLQKEYAIKRGDDPEKEKQIFEARILDEAGQFEDFENRINNRVDLGSNVLATFKFINNYNEEELREYANHLENLISEYFDEDGQLPPLNNKSYFEEA